MASWLHGRLELCKDSPGRTANIDAVIIPGSDCISYCHCLVSILSPNALLKTLILLIAFILEPTFVHNTAIACSSPLRRNIFSPWLCWRSNTHVENFTGAFMTPICCTWIFQDPAVVYPIPRQRPVEQGIANLTLNETGKQNHLISPHIIFYKIFLPSSVRMAKSLLATQIYPVIYFINFNASHHLENEIRSTLLG